MFVYKYISFRFTSLTALSIVALMRWNSCGTSYCQVGECMCIVFGIVSSHLRFVIVY